MCSLSLRNVQHSKNCFVRDNFTPSVPIYSRITKIPQRLEENFIYKNDYHIYLIIKMKTLRHTLNSSVLWNFDISITNTEGVKLFSTKTIFSMLYISKTETTHVGVMSSQ